MAADIVLIFEVDDYDAQVHRAAELLRQGGLVILPTETVYGAAALLTHPAARERLRALRGGDRHPFTIHLGRREDATRYLGEVSEIGRRMIRKLWPGPIGLMFDVPPQRRQAVAQELNIAESEIYMGDTITLRCPEHIVAADVISAVGDAWDAPVVLTQTSSGTTAPQTGNLFPSETQAKVD